MENKYLNPWIGSEKKRRFFVNSYPLVHSHRKVKVYKAGERSYDLVYKGVCIFQTAAFSTTTIDKVIDGILEGRVRVNDTIKDYLMECGFTPKNYQED